MSLNSLWSRRAQADKETLEQLKEVIDLADQFDRLQALPIWEKVIRHLGEHVQAALLEQSKHIYNPEMGRICHTIWNAKREAVDDLLGWIDATQRERDRIVEEYKETADGRNSSAAGD